MRRQLRCGWISNVPDLIAGPALPPVAAPVAMAADAASDKVVTGVCVRRYSRMRVAMPSDAKRDAEFAVAREKCDSLASDAKDCCITEAKARFGKS